MHRSSENVAAIATALAKAQTELSNPEKAMIGTVYNARSDIPQSFRYASLSSGLDIIRKALGGHQIAVAQTTHIDRATSMVNLTTVLLHTSGEWLSSDWPVCQLSETAAPRRMGAALTYARRYALFTMVGIAGEDDLDAPDSANDEPPRGTATETTVARSSRPEPAPARSSRLAAAKPDTPPSQQRLSPEQSAAARAQLIQDIQTLPGGDLQPRAIAILKAKNRLSVDDAKLVEEAFAATMALQGASSEAQALDQPLSTADTNQHQPHLPSTGVVKRPRGLPKKAKTENDSSAATAMPSQPAIDENPPASINRQADAAPAKIDKSQLTFGEIRRLRDKAHLKFVASQPCLICGRSPADAHHLGLLSPARWASR